MNVLSLFDGCSGFQLALVKAGIKYDNYFSCEIDKYASSVTRLNFPSTIELGDINNPKIPFFLLPKIDILSAGFPCQDLSFSKANGKGLEGSRSGLFYKTFEVLELLRKKNPNIKFILENVKMKKKWENIISEKLGVEPVLINSKDFSAQNRQRLYWSNIEIDSYKTSDTVLKDILEENPKTKGGQLELKFEEKTFSSDCHHIGNANIKGNESIKRVYKDTGKASCLTTMQGGHREPKVFIEPNNWRKLSPLECERLQTIPDNYTSMGLTFMDIKEENAPDNYYYSEKMLQWIERHGKLKNKSLRIQGDREKVQMIEASHFKGCSSQRFFGIPDKKGLRYITVLECERSQTVPDKYTSYGQNIHGEIKPISNSQRYKMLGNGFTINVLVWILRNVKKQQELDIEEYNLCLADSLEEAI